MKHIVNRLLLVCILSFLCVLTGCGESGEQLDAPSLGEAAVIAALEETGLQGVISTGETSSQAKEHIHYVIRDGSGGDVSEESPFVADISYANSEKGWALYTVFTQTAETERITWENWKMHIVFATLLYDGFDENDAVYEALSQKEPSVTGDALHWAVQLPDGYCVARYSSHSHTVYDDDGFLAQQRTATLRVDLYDSYELYQELSAQNEG